MNNSIMDYPKEVVGLFSYNVLPLANKKEQVRPSSRPDLLPVWQDCRQLQIRSISFPGI
jgi:hypothetical protein